MNNPVQLGGPGRVVEIDKSLFSRRKYNRGRVVEGQSIFGRYESITKEGFLIPVAQDFQHGTVNLSLHIVDPLTNVTTNRVEAMWCRSKAKLFEAMFGTHRDMIPDHLCEFMWMQWFKEHAFFHIWDQVTTNYPVN